MARLNDPATTAENRALLTEALQQQQQQQQQQQWHQQGVQQGTLSSQAAAASGAATVYLRERDPRVRIHEQQQGHAAPMPNPAAAAGSIQQQQQHNGVLVAASSPAPPAFLQTRSSYSRRRKDLIGLTKPQALEQLNHRRQRQQLLLGQPLRQPDLGPECQLCLDHTGSLMWSGEVRWMTADRTRRGSFKACGHLFTSLACAAAAAAVGGSRSSDEYWLRYCRLPAVLEFVVGQRSRSFEQAVWQAPAAAGSTS
jgi:hypothetical protein